MPVLAHAIRLGIRDHQREEKILAGLAGDGLRGLEVYHSDHGPADAERYRAIANRYNLGITGGSDYHGEAKPAIRLGGARVAPEVLAEFRRRFA